MSTPPRDDLLQHHHHKHGQHPSGSLSVLSASALLGHLTYPVASVSRHCSDLTTTTTFIPFEMPHSDCIHPPPPPLSTGSPSRSSASSVSPTNTTTSTGVPVQFEFACQLAEGSPTHYVSNFASMIELYEKIAECFDVSPKEIIYCTLNTPKVDLDRVLGGQIGLDDIIFVHRKGTRKHVEVTKSEPFLGLTIADNGNGCSYIKKIKDGSTASRVPFIKAGDHIESIMDKSMIGCRHYEVAHFLKGIPLGAIFTVTLIEPISSAFRNGKGTLRMRNNRLDLVDVSSASNRQMSIGLASINRQLEAFIGINDDELAEELWHLTLVHKNPAEFAEAIESTDLADFRFTNDFIYDIWATVDDVLHERIVD